MLPIADLVRGAKAVILEYAPVVGLAVTAWLAGTLIYNIYFHPLRHFPGPLLSRASAVPWALRQFLGQQAFETHKFHEKYGSVVRIGPNHLTFTDPQAWKDIYSYRVAGNNSAPEMPKAPAVSNIFDLDVRSITNADWEEHQRLRRGLSHGFSDGALRQQEPVIAGYVDLLMQQLHKSCENGKKALNMEAWYNWTTFDIVGDLVFGSAFGCLENMDYHPWIKLILDGVKYASAPIGLAYLGFRPFLKRIYLSGALAPITTMEKYVEDFVRDRLAKEVERVDLFGGIVKRREEWNLSFAQVSATAFILVIAGSETSATTLAGATYLLLSNPEALRRLQEEVRSSFGSSSEINITSVNSLAYTVAVLTETLRMYPPLSSGMVRVVPEEGVSIAGHPVPAGTLVEVQHWAMYHSKDNWADPWKFSPERFLVDPDQAAEAGNKLHSLQPFSTGARNCIGRNLAYAEMRLILARIIYDFDMKLADDSQQWIERQKAYMLWDRLPLNVYLTPVSRGRS